MIAVRGAAATVSDELSTMVPIERILAHKDNPVRSENTFVLYWMTACRRTTWNFALQRAVQWARELSKPLLVAETLLCGRRWASDRHHRFALEGMAASAQRLHDAGVAYYPYVEDTPRGATGLLRALASKACVIVGDDHPILLPPSILWAESAGLPVRTELVDSNGLLPVRSTDRVFTTAYAFRRFLQRNLASHLCDLPQADPLSGANLPRLRVVPEDVAKRWALAAPPLLAGGSAGLEALPIDHAVAPVETRGGTGEAERALTRFLSERLHRYAAERNSPEEDVTSGLSPYLHWGHISAHQIFSELAKAQGWSPNRISGDSRGSKTGWWGMDRNAEAFLDQLVTWRELGFNMCAHRGDFDSYESLPTWALKTLAKHEADPRDSLYTLDHFEAAQTHDPLWNAAQTQLVQEGRIHNYLRMLWGKKILEWSRSPREALGIMIELNHKYALDGRDPNSYSGIFWVLGRYDRAWGPERPVFGKVRYMSSRNTARKVRVSDYIRRYTPAVGRAM